MGFDNLDTFLESIKSICKSKIVYIWGIKTYGNLLGKLFDKKGILWSGYYDNADYKSERQLNFKPIYQGKYMDVSEKAVYILCMRNYKEVKNQLMLAGMSEEQIIYFNSADILDAIGDMLGHSVSTGIIKSLYNKHRGKKCFIIGNGPSLSIEDLDLIYNSKMISFASNLIFRCYDKTKWRPNYHFFSDGEGIRETFNDDKILQYVCQNCKYVFIRSSGDLGKCNCDIENLVFFKSVFSTSEKVYDFSVDCSEKIYMGYTVTYAMLQMAVYMGFNEIYLLGTDHCYSEERNEDGIVIKNEGVKDHSEILGHYSWGTASIQKTTLAYESAKKYADLHGIKIYNATRGGKLEVFDRVSMDTLFK